MIFASHTAPDVMLETLTDFPGKEIPDPLPYLHGATVCGYSLTIPCSLEPNFSYPLSKYSNETLRE